MKQFNTSVQSLVSCNQRDKLIKLPRLSVSIKEFQFLNSVL